MLVCSPPPSSPSSSPFSQLMTDVDFLYTANPKNDPNATPIYEVGPGGNT